MRERKHCPNCSKRIHPLELSDLLRGRKVRCAYCRFTLQATAKGPIAVVAASLFGLITAFPDLLPAGESLWTGLALGLLIALLLYLLPPGLIAGAPWVGIEARGPEDRIGVGKRAGRMEKGDQP